MIPWVIALQQYNLLGSHDTPRIRSAVKGKDALHRLAAVILLTYPGVPGIYYGDEIGLEDTPELRSRNCMPWDETRWDQDLLAFYRQMIALRRQSSILQRGGFQVLAAEPDTLAYLREDKTGRILVVAHRAETPRPANPLTVAHGGIPDGTTFTELFSGQTGVVRKGLLPLPTLPQGATVWQQR